MSPAGWAQSTDAKHGHTDSWVRMVGGGTWKEGPRAGVDQAPCRNRMLPRCPKSVNGGQVDILEAESRVNLASLGGFRGRGEVGGMWKRKIPTEDK